MAPTRITRRPHPDPPTSPLAGLMAVTPEQAAQMIGVSRTTIYALIASGEIPSFKARRARRIRIADLEAWMAAGIEEDPHLKPQVQVQAKAQPHEASTR